MFKKTLGSIVAFGFCAVATLSAFDAEAGCHRHRRAACCNPCPTVCCDPCASTVISYAAPAAPCCGTVVEEVIVTGCCMASATPAAPTIAATEESQPSRQIAATSVSVVRSSR
jgi:hypothetical protein